MHLLALAASVLGIEVDELLEHAKKNAMAWSAVALFALIALVFVLVALNAWFTLLWGPIVAPLLIAAGALLVALGVYAAIAISDGIARRHAAERRNSAEKTALVTTAALTALPLVLKSDLMKKVGIPIGGAIAAAYLLTKPGSSRSGHHSNGHDPD
jgi:membrane protein implicated in regulation of membrane protease activity